ncbi:MAG: NnrU family protein [Dehalococcoidia bacterium]|jgi:uncharacterized membrane protein|nr:NnrU family protein [Dehalococcoidia bacterium]
MGLAILIVGLVALLVPHVFVSQRKARAAVIDRLGEGPYKLAFSLVSAVGIVLIGWGFARYRATGWVELWSPPAWTRHAAVALMWPSVVLVVAAYASGHIKRILKHPMLAGIKLWAFAHLLANGDLGSIVLFGSILAWAVYDRISLRHRTDSGAPPVPIGGWGRDVIAVVVGTLLYLGLGLWFHPLVIGVPVFAG